MMRIWVSEEISKHMESGWRYLKRALLDVAFIRIMRKDSINLNYSASTSECTLCSDV